MATVQDVEAGPLREIAYRIPGVILATMEPLEARLRCSWIHDLQSRAANEPPDKAQRTRKLAERVIVSMSDYEFSAAQAELSQAMTDAKRRGDDRAAFEALSDLRGLEARHPRVPEERTMAHAAAVLGRAMERKLTIPARTGSRLFSRRLGRK